MIPIFWIWKIFVATQYKVELSSTELVPGDYVLFPTNGGYTVECDAVLVDGSCVVNESMLTGESIPVTKVSIPDENVKFNYDQQRQYIIFQGTQVSLTPYQTNMHVQIIHITYI